jgi:hypothetical protein
MEVTPVFISNLSRACFLVTAIVGIILEDSWRDPKPAFVFAGTNRIRRMENQFPRSHCDGAGAEGKTLNISKCPNGHDAHTTQETIVVGTTS